MDEKGRVRIPAKFRSVLCGTMSIMPSLNGSLFLLPQSKSDDEIEKLANLELYDKDKQDSSTLVMSYSYEVEEDSQGRILLSSNITNLVKIKKEVVFVGKGTYAELWPAEEWERKFNLLSSENMDAMLEKMKSYGI